MLISGQKSNDRFWPSVEKTNWHHLKANFGQTVFDRFEPPLASIDPFLWPILTGLLTTLRGSFFSFFISVQFIKQWEWKRHFRYESFEWETIANCCARVVSSAVLPTQWVEIHSEVSTDYFEWEFVTFHEQQQCGYGFPSLPLATRTRASVDVTIFWKKIRGTHMWHGKVFHTLGSH